MANLYWPKRQQFRSDDRRRRRFEQRFLDAEGNADEVLIVSHRGCLDGTGSVIAALRAMDPEKVGVATCQPSDMQRALEILSRAEGRGRRLLIADLSLNPQQFDGIVAACKRLKEQGWRIEWRDHHHKQWEGVDLDRLLPHVDVLTVNDDATESGASLMQQALAPDDGFGQRLAETIRDRDLWWNKTPDSETLEFAITEMGNEAFTEHYLDKGDDEPVVDEKVQAAADKQRARVERDAKRLLGRTRYFRTKHGEEVGIVYGWLPKNVGLHRVLDHEDVQVAINVRPNGNMSLRSRQGADVCQLIAREFDGGGHPNASGATLGLQGASFWWYVLRRGRVRRVAEVAASAIRHLEARKEA